MKGLTRMVLQNNTLSHPSMFFVVFSQALLTAFRRTSELRLIPISLQPIHCGVLQATGLDGVIMEWE